MSTEKDARITRAKEGLEECKVHLQKIVSEWDGCSEFMRGNVIGSVCIYIHFCDCFTSITQEFVETIFRENGGWAADHPLTMGVIQRLREWGALRN
jgi:hypothetical protein